MSPRAGRRVVLERGRGGPRPGGTEAQRRCPAVRASLSLPFMKEASSLLSTAYTAETGLFVEQNQHDT